MTDMMTQKRPLTLRLSEDKIPAKQFKVAVDAFISVLDEVTSDFGRHNDNVEVEWGISVKSGSSILIATPESSYKGILPVLTDSIVRGIAELERGGERPSYFNDKALGAVRALSKISNDNCKVQLRAGEVETQLSETLTTAVGHVLDAKYTDYGSLEGYMQVISNRGKVKAKLYDDLTDRPINCLFPNYDETILDALFESMKSNRRVEVSGEISYRADGQPLKILVESFDVFPPSESLPDIEDIIGILKAVTNG